VSGTAASCSAVGTIATTGTNSIVDIRFVSDADTPTLEIESGSLQVIGIPVI